ncbi:MAG: 23S rRNA (uracil(1939)-C(5))-methyltransferase RlmD [Hyphomonadaceae bacterium]|nr:23S rRNA (uracil(1939)-C(5))-methyltransferase RlmD [Clostridia bacterium]
MNNQPIQKNDIVTINVTALGLEGEGIGRVDTFAVFVPNALVGDIVEVKIIKVKSHFGYGKIINIVTPSKARINPACESFPQCGGCQMQHMDYRQQLLWKQQAVTDSLVRIGKLQDVVVHPTIGMADPTHYRNKAQYPIRQNTVTGEIEIGFFAKQSHRIVQSDSCMIGHKDNAILIQIVKEWMKKNHIRAYDETSGKGLMRHLYTRTTHAKQEWMVVLVTNGDKQLPFESLIQVIQTQLPSIKSIYQNINTRRDNTILGSQNRLLWGESYLFDTIGDCTFRISPHSFFQVNSTQTAVLYQTAIDYADLKGHETVFDLYCGIGTISLFLANKAKKVIGIEVVPQAIEDANENAKINNITNTKFLTGTAEDITPKLQKQGIKPDIIVIDPPRKGCEQALLDILVVLNPPKIVYVSCNPATLARDLNFLTQNGYTVKAVQPVDMFPWTRHVETVVLIERK